MHRPRHATPSAPHEPPRRGRPASGLRLLLALGLALAASGGCGGGDGSDGGRGGRRPARRDLKPVQSFVRLSEPGDLSEASFTRYDSFLSREYDPAAGLGVPAQDPVGQPLRREPHGLALSADGSRLYVTLPGNVTEPLREVGVIDVSTGTLTGTIQVGLHPLGIEPTPDGRFLVVANEYSNYLSVIDTATDRVVAEPLSRFYNQEIVFLEPTRAAVTNRAWDSVDFYVFRTVTGEMQYDGEVPVHTVNRPFEVGLPPTDGPSLASPDGSEDLTALGLPTGPGEPYDLATERVLVGTNPRDLGYAGGRLYVCTENGLGVSVVDPDLRAVVGTIDLNSPARGCAVWGPYVFFASGGRLAQAETGLPGLAERVRRDPGRNEIGVVDVRSDPFRLLVRYTSVPNPPNGPGTGPPADLATGIALRTPPDPNVPWLSGFGDPSVPNTDTNRDRLPTLVYGAVPNRMTTAAGRLYVTMAASDGLEIYDIDTSPPATQDVLTRSSPWRLSTNSDGTEFPSAIDTSLRTDEGRYLTGEDNPGFFDGRMPEQVVASPDGRQVFVACRLGESVAHYDLDRAPGLHVSIDLTLPGMPRFPATLAEIGEDAFNTSRFTLDRNFSCLTCHPSSNTDSKLWKAGAAPGNVMRDPISVRNQHDVFPHYNSGGRVHAETFRANTRDFSADELFGGALSPSPTDVNGDGRIDADDEGYALGYHMRNAMYVFERFGFGIEYVGAALAAYLEAEPRLPPNPFGGLDAVPVSVDVATAQRTYGDPAAGEEVFYEARCHFCHPPPVTTIHQNMTVATGMMDIDGDGIPDGVVPSWERDTEFGAAELLSVPIEQAETNGGDDDPDVWRTVVNTVDPRSPVTGRRLIIPEADARNVRIKPHRGMWDSAPYLHHGRAATLLDVVSRNRPWNGYNRHGMLSDLTEEEARDLAAYLQTIE